MVHTPETRLVCLVHLVCLMQPNNGLHMLGGLFSILIAGKITPRSEQEGNNIYSHPPLSHCPSQLAHEQTGH